MRPPPITTTSAPNSIPNYAVTLATIGAVLAILAVPFAFIPFLGLAGSCLVLGLIVLLASPPHTIISLPVQTAVCDRNRLLFGHEQSRFNYNGRTDHGERDLHA